MNVQLLEGCVAELAFLQADSMAADACSSVSTVSSPALCRNAMIAGGCIALY